MNKDIRNILLVNLAILLVLPLFFGVGGFSDYLTSIGFTALFTGALNLVAGFIGLIVLSIQDKKTTAAQGLLLSSGLLFLASFTLCSTGFMLKL